MTPRVRKLAEAIQTLWGSDGDGPYVDGLTSERAALAAAAVIEPSAADDEALRLVVEFGCKQSRTVSLRPPAPDEPHWLNDAAFELLQQLRAMGVARPVHAAYGTTALPKEAGSAGQHKMNLNPGHDQ